jgi:hypothetical protein
MYYPIGLLRTATYYLVVWNVIGTGTGGHQNYSVPVPYLALASPLLDTALTTASIQISAETISPSANAIACSSPTLMNRDDLLV